MVWYCHAEDTSRDYDTNDEADVIYIAVYYSRIHSSKFLFHVANTVYDILLMHTDQSP